jgi:Sulfotransferase family
MLPKKFIFCHIPKVAGTLFGQILDRNFGKKFYPYYGLWDNRFFTKEDVAGMCDLHPQYECLASHMFSLDLPFDSKRFDFRAICFVRDPVERALSLYFYTHRMAKLNTGYVPPESPQEFFKTILGGEDDVRFCNAQFRFLCSNQMNSLTMEDIESLAEKGKLLIAPVSRFDDACLLLEKTYSEHFKNASYGRRSNVSRKSQEVPAEIRSALENLNARDLELFRFAGEFFEATFLKQFPNPGLIESVRKHFQSRCSKMRLLEKVKKIQRKLTNR